MPNLKPLPTKPSSSNFAQKLADLGGEAIKQTANQAGDAAGQALEQMGMGGAGVRPGQQKMPPQGSVNLEKAELEQKKAEKQAQAEQEAAKIVRELEAEIAKHRCKREEQLAARRQQAPPEEGAETLPPKKVLPQDSKKPKGLMAGLRARKRKTQQELSGMRRSG